MVIEKTILSKVEPKDTTAAWAKPVGENIQLNIFNNGKWRPIAGGGSPSSSSSDSSESNSGCNCNNSDSSGSESSTAPDTTEPILLTGETYVSITTSNMSGLDLYKIIFKTLFDEFNLTYDPSIFDIDDFESFITSATSILETVPPEIADSLAIRASELESEAGSLAKVEKLQELNTTSITTEAHGKVVQVYYNPEFGYIFECEDGCGISYDGNNKLSVIPAELRYAITEDYAGGYDRFTGESIPNCMVHQLTTTVAKTNAQTSYGLMPVYTLVEYNPSAPSDGVDGSDPVIYSVWRSSSGGYDIILGVESSEPVIS